MDKNKETFIFTAEDIFEEIPDDPENVLMKIPDEVLKIAGWKEGDVLNIKIEDGKLLINKHE
jgi:frataxin-like iron-binding protein CyaY